jgi:putative ABC transport system permease protein
MLLLRAIGGGYGREGIARRLFALLGIALGVALGTAVHLVNHSAKSELTLAMQNLAGTADLIVRSARGGFAEETYPRVAKLPSVESASPAVEAEASVRVGDRIEPLRVLGMDPMRAMRVQPALLGNAGGSLLDLLAGDTVLLSAAAAQWLTLQTGDILTVSSGSGELRLRVGGILPTESYAQRVAVMDIAAVQWRFGRLGVLTRIDVRARPGADLATLERDIASELPAGVHVVTPDSDARQGEQISRAYRVNLDMLALVALFTGGFLVFSTQALALMRSRTHLAVLRALGLTRRALLGMLLARSALTGAIGAGAGVALGTAAGAAALQHLGSDLGAGYFPGLAVRPHIDPWALLVFFMLGVSAAVLGTLVPAIRTANLSTAAALKPGDHGYDADNRHRLWPGLTLLGSAALLSQAPAVDGLPVFGYLAIAVLLVGALALMPSFVQAACAVLPAARSPILMLAFGKLRGSPSHVTLSLAAILTSFSLMASMLIMVTSFRGSLEGWLGDILPADVYVRAGGPGRDSLLDPAAQAAISSTAGVARVSYARHESIALAADRPALSLIARDLPEGMPDALPLVGEARLPPSNGPPAAWISEAVRDLYGFAPGDRIILPLLGSPVEFVVAGVWRDYARQGGAILIDRRVFAARTGESNATDAWVWRAADITNAALAVRLRERLSGIERVELREPAELRAASLRTFDRTFAITYALELVAVLIGLLGISAAFGADALARRAEHGMLRHLGLHKREIVRMLAVEGAMVGAAGVAAGLSFGWMISLVLVHVINRQSFHWSLDMHFPVAALAGLGAVLVVAAAATAAASARSAMAPEALAAVREDW